jgi:DNA-binding HxlR family transcriptional regulator
MTGKRAYDDPCGIARALDVLGERWALLVVRELVLGPKRYTDLRAGLPGISTDVLAQRLRELEVAGVLHRTMLPPPASARVYELTDRGHDLEPLLLELGRWGSREPLPATDRDLGVDSFALALRTVFDPEAATDLDATIGLRLGADRLVARVRGGVLDLRRGEPDEPDAVLETEVAGLREVLWHKRPLRDAVAAGDVGVSGDRTVVRRFLKLFPAPKPTTAAATT